MDLLTTLLKEQNPGYRGLFLVEQTKRNFMKTVAFLLFLTWIITIGFYEADSIKLNNELKYVKMVNTYNYNMSENHREISEQVPLLKSYIKDLFDSHAYLLTLTGYHPVSEQTDSTPDITADGTKFKIPIAGSYRIVALSRDLLKRWGGPFSYGDIILVKGTRKGKFDGAYQVRDTMHERHKNWIDILLTPGEKATFQKNILVYKLNYNQHDVVRLVSAEYPEFLKTLN